MKLGPMFALLLIGSWYQAFASDCHDNYLGGIRPAAIIDREICFPSFSVGYRDAQHGPLWSSEHITPERITKSGKITRHCAFHAGNLPAGAGINPRWYDGSGWDRGHLTPNGDAGSEVDQEDSCSLINVAPQDPKLNRTVWRAVEKQVQTKILETRQDGYIVTGVAYPPNSRPAPGVPGVPSFFWKAVAIGREMWAVVSANAPPSTGSCVYMSISDLESRVGPVFPSVAKDYKSQVSEVIPVFGCLPSRPGNGER